MANDQNDNPDIRKDGAVTEYRPDDQSVRGGKDHSVQSEALGADMDENLAASSATSGGAAGRFNDLDPNPLPQRDGGENPNNRQHKQ
jgi:hypothetical protein